MIVPDQFSKDLLNQLNFCVIDLETTGGNPETEKIIEIGMVKIENRKITEERSFLINPEKEIPDFVQKLTGIKKNDVLHAPKIEEVIDEVLSFAGTDVLVAHNTSFDIPFINGVLKKMGRPALENKVICTQIMTKHLIPDIMSSNLNYMSQLFNIDHSHAHRAIEDARATGELLLKYLEIFEFKHIRKVNQLYYPRNRFEMDRLIVEESESLAKVEEILSRQTIPLVLSVKGDNGVILAILPIKHPGEEVKEVMAYLKDFRWNQIHIRLTGPYIEGLFFLNNNFAKIPETYRVKTIDYLKKKSRNKKDKNKIIEEQDFVITPHLISGQFILYSFLNFSPYSQLIFKYPSHKKKLQQFLSNQVQRFEQQQKSKRKIYLQNDIKDLILDFFEDELLSNPELYLRLKNQDIKENPKAYNDRIEQLTLRHPDPYHFPTRYL